MSKDWFEVLDVQIWGGAGSVAANTEDLQRAARLQGRAQEYLTQAATWVGQAEQAIEEEWILAHLGQGHELVSNSLVPFTSLEFPTPEHMGIKNQIANQIDYLLNAIRVVEGKCEELGARVFQSAQTYSQAEQEAGSWWRRGADQASKSPHLSWGVFSPAGMMMKAQSAFIAPDNASIRERAVSGIAASVNVFGVPPGQTNVSFFSKNAGTVLGTGYDWSLKMRGVAATVWQFSPGELETHTVPAEPFAKIEDAVATVVDQRSEHNGQIMVQEQVSAGGMRSWVVYVPGTQDWEMNGQNHPIDLSGNLGLMAGDPDPMTMEYLRTVMEQAGIGPDEPVTLLGHSQGGIAVNAAQTDPWFQTRINLQSVVTICSPVGSQKTDPKVKTLHIENTRDFVPELDGQQNPNGTNRVTLSATITGDGAQHSVEQNIAILDAPSVKTDPSAQAMITGINAQLASGASGTTVTTFYEAKPKV